MSKLKEYGMLLCRSFLCFGKYRKWYGLGLLLGSFEFAVSFALPYINRQLIEDVSSQSFSSLIQTLLYMTAGFLLLTPLIILGKYLQASTVARATARLREQLFLHIMNLPYSTLKKYETGDFIVRLTDDANKILQCFNSFRISNLAWFIIAFPASLLLLIIYNWHIAAVGLIYGIVQLVISLYLNPLTKRLEEKAKGQIVNSSSFFLETLRAIPVIRVFCLQKDFSARFHRICRLIRAQRVKFRTVSGIAYGVADFFCQSAQPVAFLLGIFLSDWGMELGQAVLNATLMGIMSDSVFSLSTYLLSLQTNLVSMERVFEIWDLSEEDAPGSCRFLSSESAVAVEMKDVSFSYDGSGPVVRDINLQIKNGEHLAIVGGSGGGKSTVLRLMEAFLSPSSGEILYYGEPRSSHSLHEIRSLFAYVPQDSPLFEGSIAQNIAMGNPNASFQELTQAVKLAGLSDFVEGLPHKIDASVGERGGQLSGGQRQRIAIARALVKHAPILLLDEFTSALDAATEDEILAGLDTALKGITTVTVAHRLSTVRHADRILVMEHGEIKESGTFPELLEKEGLFYSLYQKQMHQSLQ